MAVRKDKADAYMPLWIGDYQADTAHLDAEQHGAYLLLIMAYWRSGPLPADDKKLAGIGRMTPAQWKRSRSTVLEFFQEAGGKLHHKRIDAELKDANERKASAKRSAEARWEKERRICGTDANASPTHTVPQCSSPSPSPLPFEDSKPREKKKSKKEGGDPPFPKALETEAFRAAWAEFTEYRREKKKPRFASRTVAAKFAEFELWGEAKAIQAIRNTIANGWDGVFEPKGDVPAVAGKIGTYGPDGNFICGDGLDDLSARIKREQRTNPAAFGIVGGAA